MNNTPLATQTSVMNFLNKPQLSNSSEYRRVYVGKIPPGLSDHFIIRLLEVIIQIFLSNQTCGQIASWKRGTDQNQKPRGFGYCEYQSVECMLKSLRLLNRLKLEEGYELLVSIF